MKAVIFAGGKGTRLMEETYTRPKPMVEVGGMPILWHIMKIYAAQGVDEFIVCLGHKGQGGAGGGAVGCQSMMVYEMPV